MPELPEVEIARRCIAPLLLGRVIATVHTTRPSYVFLTPPEELRHALAGRTARALSRNGKYLVATLDDDSQLVLHLGMTGQLLVWQGGDIPPRALDAAGQVADRHAPRDAVGRGLPEDVNARRELSPGALPPPRNAAQRPDAHTHLRLAFRDGGPEIWFRDARKFGKLLWLRPGERTQRLARLGVDALALTAEALCALRRGRRVTIKTLLLDQGAVAGVGNIYADETLFAAGVRPGRRAARVTRAECGRIASALAAVLERSIAAGGSSISDYIAPDGSAGHFQRQHAVYARTGLPCPRCGTAIRRVAIAMRSSHYCPRCQR